MPKLYGTFIPTWTPAHFDSGFASDAADADPDLRNAAADGRPARASCPSSRLVYSIGIPHWSG